MSDGEHTGHASQIAHASLPGALAAGHLLSGLVLSAIRARRRETGR